MKIEQLSRDELLHVLTTVKDVSPQSEDGIVFSATWDCDRDRILRLVDLKLGIEIQDEDLRQLLQRYEVAVEMAEAHKETVL